MAQELGPYRPEPITKPDAPQLGDAGFVNHQIDEGLKKLKPEEKAKVLNDKQNDQKEVVATTKDGLKEVNTEIAKTTDSVVTITLRGQGETLSGAGIDGLKDEKQKFIALVANLDGDKAGIEASSKEGLGTKFIRAFNADYGIDSTSGSQKFVVGESQLYTLMKNAHDQNSGFLTDIMERFDVKTLDVSGAEKLRNGILEATKQLQMVQDLVTNSHDTSVDIVTVLRDSDHKYIEALLTDPITIKKIAENERTNPDGFKKKLAAVIKALPDIGHTVALNNFYVRANTHELTSDGKSSALADRSIGKGRFTLNAGADATGLRIGANVNDAEHKMNEEINAMRKKIDETKDIPSLQSVVDTLVADDSSKKVIRDVISQLSQKNIPFVEIQNACANLVSQNKMIEFASTEKWNVKGVEGLVKWSGFGAILKGQSPLTVYAGIVLDKYGVEVKDGNKGLAEKIANDINNVSINFSAPDKDGYKEIPGRAIRYKELPGGKFEYRFMGGDIARATGVTDKLTFTTDTNGDQVVVTDAPLKISFKARVAPNGTQTLSFSIKEGEKVVTSAQKVTETTENVHLADAKQNQSESYKIKEGGAKELRRLQENAFKAFAHGWLEGDMSSVKKSLQVLAANNKELKADLQAAGDDPKKLLNLADTLVAINMGDQVMRNAGTKSGKKFQDIYRANYASKDGIKEQNAFQSNEVRLFEDPDGTMNQELLADRTKWKKDLSQLKFEGTEKPIEPIAPNDGYFTIVSMAQSNTKIYGLVAIPIENTIKGSQMETTALSPDNKAQLLRLAFGRQSFADRRDAILETLKNATGQDVSREDAIALLSGATTEINGVKLAKPLKFTRAQFSVCANDSFLIGKPEFVKHNRTVTSVPTPTIASIDGSVVADAGVQGGRETNMAGGAGIQKSIPATPPTPEQPKPTQSETKPTIEGGRAAEPRPGVSTTPASTAGTPAVEIPSGTAVPNTGGVDVSSALGATAEQQAKDAAAKKLLEEEAAKQLLEKQAKEEVARKLAEEKTKASLANTAGETSSAMLL